MWNKPVVPAKKKKKKKNVQYNGMYTQKPMYNQLTKTYVLQARIKLLVDIFNSRARHVLQCIFNAPEPPQTRGGSTRPTAHFDCTRAPTNLWGLSMSYSALTAPEPPQTLTDVKFQCYTLNAHVYMYCSMQLHLGNAYLSTNLAIAA